MAKKIIAGKIMENRKALAFYKVLKMI